MKVKIAIAAVLCALFVAVPSATSKGKPAPAGVAWSIVCGGSSCSVGLTGLTPGLAVTYALSVVDDCGTIFLGNTNFNADSTGAYHTTVDISAEDLKGCTTTLFTFTVSTVGRHPSVVSSTTQDDLN